MKFIQQTILLVLLLTTSYSHAIEILSKKEAERTFNKSLDDWKYDAKLLLNSKRGDVIQSNDISVTMLVPVDNSILKITPVYKVENTKKPWKIAVSIEQNTNLSTQTKRLGDEGLRKLVSKWYEEMLPEFTVMTEFDLQGENLQINFSIFEYGSNKLVDDVAREANGCWQGCIKK
jgi:hypothetical protein